MQVKLIEGMFQSDVCNLSITDEGVVFFKPDRSDVVVPFTEICNFNLEDRGGKKQRFVLQTFSREYEGFFFKEEDAIKTIQLLKNKCNCYVDVHLDMK